MSYVTDEEINDTGWGERVISLFAPDELVDGRPKVDGLRRLVSTLLGRIIESEASVIESPTDSNGHRAIVEYRVVVDRTLGQSREDKRSYKDVAEVNRANTDPKFYNAFPVSTCATRAEARTLRKLLRLRTIAYEESAEADKMEADGEPIRPNQITDMNRLGKRGKINVVAVIKNVVPKFKAVSSLSRDQGATILAKLNELANVDVVPEEYKGYSEGWEV